MKRRTLLFTVLLAAAVTSASHPSEKPQEAQAVLDAAMKQSKEQKKPIWLIFDASW